MGVLAVVANPADWSTELFRVVVIATGGLLSAAVVAALRYIRAIDRRRIDQMAKVEHRQWHVLRWVHRAGRDLNIPFPLEDDIDEHDDWDEGLK